MHFRHIILGLAFSLAHFSSGDTLPDPPDDSYGFIVSLVASDYFLNSKGNLSIYDVDAYYSNYDANTTSWLKALDPNTGATDEDKAKLLTEAAYAKKFDEQDSDMVEDVQSLLATVSGNISASVDVPAFQVSSRHAVIWEDCISFFACKTGKRCVFRLRTNREPRSVCEQRGGSHCCISWSTYKISKWFFPTTWTYCDGLVREQARTSASCKGFGSKDERGNICLSNRAGSCT
ncbi:hypothetical protein N7509_013053 [Penicillium cosmopolitanum]|uniref:Uncharacterized protein n=1 Tax=Penicillium cosmopolitanum TaxID=1131564 RepID=A0A9W9VBS2_9EURO|nr:uncharacterized protein N7509_013053 [Penicillium cosmopolitanum]KAJ5376167.1 hypothetical protein N7509_013053 [Penicillium cosmopolitanum]